MKGIQNTSNDTYRQLMGNGLRYEVPKFQRDYSWQDEHWDDLWLDMLLLWNKGEEEHYMGYLVLQTTDNKNFTVIDGQQRLATLSILILGVLKLLTKWIEEGTGKEDNQVRLNAYRNAYIGTLDTVTLISDNKLKLNRNGDDYYRNNMVLLKELLPLRNTNVSEKGMRSCFLWFYDKLSRKFQDGKSLAEFVEAIVDKLFFTVITVTDEINAFKVFETLNARGVQLSSSDLLKNYLFSKVDSASDTSKNEIEELENLWSRIIGKLGSEKFENYLRYYWNSKNKTVRKNQLYKTIRKSITDKKAAFELVRDLDDTADLFIAIQDPQSSYWDDLAEIKKPLSELKRFRIKQAYSLLMSGCKNLDDKPFLKLVKVISIISFRYNVIGGLNPNEQEEVYNKTANSIYKNKKFEIKDLQPVYSSDKSFQEAFSTKIFKSNSNNHKIVKYILSKIEQYKFRNEIDPEIDHYTIEHILPKSADESWGDFSNEEVNRSIYKLGNLTLLEKKLNKNADTLKYDEKKKIFKESNCNLTKAIPEDYETWTEKKIVARQEEFSKAAKSIWKIQELT